MNRIKHSALALAVAALAGCAPPKNATTARLDDLQREISRLKASNIALAERLEAVEAQAPQVQEEASLAALGDAGDAKGDDRPPLDVVRLAPESEEAPPATDAGDADPAFDVDDRPVISGAGQKVEQVAPTTSAARAPGGRR